MNVFAMIVLVVLIGGIIAVLIVGQVSKNADNVGGGGEAILRELNQRLKNLEKRVQNLESIITSKDYDLHREFEDLERQT